MFHRSLYQLFHHHHHYYYVYFPILEQDTFGYKSGKNLAQTQCTCMSVCGVFSTCTELVSSRAFFHKYTTKGSRGPEEHSQQSCIKYTYLSGNPKDDFLKKSFLVFFVFSTTLYDSGNSSFVAISHAAFVNDVGGKCKRKNTEMRKKTLHIISKHNLEEELYS